MPDLHDLLDRRAERFELAPEGLGRLRHRAERRSRTRRVSIVVMAFALVTVTGVGLWQAFAPFSARQPIVTPPPPTVSPGPATSPIEATISVPAYAPAGLVPAGGYLWYVASDDGSLRRIDPKTDRPVGAPLYCSMSTPVAAFGSLWTSGDNGNGCLPGPTQGARLWRIDPSTGSIVAEIDVASETAWSAAPDVSAGEGAIWLSSSAEIGTGDNFEGVSGILARVDPTTNRVTGSIRVNEDDLRVAAGLGAVWLVESPQSGRSPGTLLRVDPHSMRIDARIAVGRSVGGLALGSGSVWVSNSNDGTVTRVDASTNDVLATVTIRDGTSGLVVAPDGIWTSDRNGNGVLSRIDPSTDTVTARIRLPVLPPGGEAFVETFGFGSLWARSIPHTIYRIAPVR